MEAGPLAKILASTEKEGLMYVSVPDMMIESLSLTV
jgi:hypothetical protein